MNTIDIELDGKRFMSWQDMVIPVVGDVIHYNPPKKTLEAQREPKSMRLEVIKRDLVIDRGQVRELARTVFVEPIMLRAVLTCKEIK